MGTADRDLALDAEDSLFELELHVVLEVTAALLARWSTAAAAHVEHLAKKIAEDVSKVTLLERAAAREAV